MLRLHETDFLPRRNRKPELSDNAVRIHESHAVVAAVLAVVPVVAEYKVLSLPDRDRLGGKSRVCDGRKFIFFIIDFPVDEDLTVPDLYRLARQHNHTLDVDARLLVLTRPERDDIPAFRRT